MILIIGSFGPHVYSLHFNTLSGQLSYLCKSSLGSATSWLASGKDDNVLYATDETGVYCGCGEYENNVGAILVINVNYDDLKCPLTKVQSVLSKGDGPTHISLNSDKNCLLVANYWGGTTSSFDIDDMGLIHNIKDSVIDLKLDSQFRLGPNKERQESSHPHWIGEVPLSRGKYIYSTDLGQDKIFQYELVNCKLIPLSVPFINTAKGSGPRHIAFNTSQPFLYVVNELTCSVSVYPYDITSGELQPEVQCLPSAPLGRLSETCPSGIVVDKGNSHVYVTNRDISNNKTGSDSISVFRITEQRLILVQNISSGGLFPRYGNLSPDENWYLVGNQGNDRVDVFSRDVNSGILEWKGGIDGIEKPTFIYFKE